MHHRGTAHAAHAPFSCGGIAAGLDQALRIFDGVDHCRRDPHHTCIEQAGYPGWIAAWNAHQREYAG